MSKMDDLRAMREARYERSGAAPASKAAPAGTPAKATPAVAPTAAVKPAKSAEAVPDEVIPGVPAAELCGHRAISGRTCTREAGHSAKSHRYA